MASEIDLEIDSENDSEPVSCNQFLDFPVGSKCLY